MRVCWPLNTPACCPSSLWLETVRAFCDHFETPLPELLESLSTERRFIRRRPSRIDRAAIFLEWLGLSPAEQAIFADPEIPRGRTMARTCTATFAPRSSLSPTALTRRLWRSNDDDAVGFSRRTALPVLRRWVGRSRPGSDRDQGNRRPGLSRSGRRPRSPLEGPWAEPAVGRRPTCW
jgi:hypothetical protein